ncbi:efflux RND transporter periplasmic adaptor subunit [Massilia sp. NR 4-1]|uniref:efflux RND transporter periplasmic adaptor subunit n=1 Tax=Massilia sp. NR 4-1 TaxID=1678028 RepID=UPI00067AD848|nr:efflux RND transporter periplasmic adaptor subunit [Massilia sp. NR 4-1]AKU21675.1 RND transporter MFP subunit [Massilia sp. NR 4-1]
MKLLFALSALSLALLPLTGCDSSQDKAAMAKAAGTPVSAALVVQRDIVETQEFPGRLEAIERVAIRPRVSGYITSVHFTPGSLVKKGDVLFTIDARPYQAQLNKAEADAHSARARADLAKVELERAERLLADRAIAQREFDERASSQKELDATARAAQAATEAARLNMAYTKVLAPIGGRVSKAEITVGNLVDGNAVLTSVVSTDKIYASFEGDEDTYLRVAGLKRAGAPVPVHIALNNEQGYPHAGELDFIDNRLDTNTGSVRMRAVLKNAERNLVPGLFVRVQVATGNGRQQATRAVLVNERAIGTDLNRKFVFIVNRDGKAEYRAVTLGAQAGGGLRIVQSGLQPDDKVILDGLQHIRPGAALSVQTIAMDSAIPTQGKTPSHDKNG